MDLRGIAYECDIAEAVEDAPAVFEVLLRGTLTRQSEIEPVGSADDLIDRLIWPFAPKFDQGLVKVGDLDTGLSPATGPPHGHREQTVHVDRRSIPLKLRRESDSLDLLEWRTRRTPANRSNELVHRAPPARQHVKVGIALPTAIGVQFLKRDDPPDLVLLVDADSCVAYRTTEIFVPRVRRLQNDYIGPEGNIHIPSDA